MKGPFSLSEIQRRFARLSQGSRALLQPLVENMDDIRIIRALQLRNSAQTTINWKYGYTEPAVFGHCSDIANVEDEPCNYCRAGNGSFTVSKYYPMLPIHC